MARVSASRSGGAGQGCRIPAQRVRFVKVLAAGYWPGRLTAHRSGKGPRQVLYFKNERLIIQPMPEQTPIRRGRGCPQRIDERLETREALIRSTEVLTEGVFRFTGLDEVLQGEDRRAQSSLHHTTAGSLRPGVVDHFHAATFAAQTGSLVR